MPHKLARIARMDWAELSWRGHAAVRTLLERGAAAVRQPGWRRDALASALAGDPALDPARDALRRGDWMEAHRRLSQRLFTRPAAFLVASDTRPATVQRILQSFPAAARSAAGRADRILNGEYDLLGYRGLVFRTGGCRALSADQDAATLPDWHCDPAHGRRAPHVFWADVPFLDPSCGDHKIIWELNRHQHWLALGRAFWLTNRREYRDRFVRELMDWMDANPPLVGVNWASMLELSLRCLSWIWALHLFVAPDDPTDDSPWTVDLLLAADRQLTHVERHLSYYFSPNTHLLGEALALYVSGRALPELAAGPRRERLGRQILVAELARQVEPDGGHCERSTHYHRYTLDFYAMALAVARITDDPIAAVFERALRRLGAAARTLCDDSGRAPHLGDDDGGMLMPIAGRAPDDWRDSLAIAALLTGADDLAVGAAPEEARWFLSHRVFAPAWDAQESRRPAAPARWLSTALPETGYYVSRSAAGEHIVVDGGRHGYLNAGHAHADALALTLSLRGRPLLIDPGTGCYTTDAGTRDRFRSTALHNTLLLDGRSQSTPAGPFRWHRTADASAHRWRTTDGFDYFDGSHDGYAPAIHRRRVLAMHGDLVIVADHVDDPGRAAHSASVHWHVDPAWTVDRAGDSVAFRSRHEHVALIVPQGRVTIAVAEPATGLGWHSPVYGRIEPASTVVITREGPAPFWIVSVFDLNPLDPVRETALMPVWAEAGAVMHAIGLRVARRQSTDFVLFAEPSTARSGVSWRAAEIETDARCLLCSVDRNGALSRLALVDGSFVHGAGRRTIALRLGHITPALYLDQSTIGHYTPCAASPAS